ncbi:MAG: glutathione S-transferase family protein [Gammaproteobacteria bacterium]
MSNPAPLANPHAMRLYSARVCPFVQRVRLALLEKGLEYETVDVDLDNIPDWYRSISPYGKVPLLQRGGDSVWESTVINEYLEEVYPEPPLLPRDPGQRALARIWIDYANTQFLPWFYKLLLEQDAGRQQELAQRLSEALRYMEGDGIGASDGDYWLGGRLTLVDLAFYPFFERFPVLDHYRSYRLPEECARLRQWIMAMQARASVEQIRNPDDFYVERYARYADGSVSGGTAQEMRDA